jgi:hypothetical protein
MPVGTDWRCCDCGQVWSYAMYAACVFCHHRRCICCTTLVMLSKPHDINYPSVRGQSDSARGIYTCCGCNDGPKRWARERRCVICSHLPCSSCTYGKAGASILKPDSASPNPRSQRVEEDERLSRLGHLVNSSQKLPQTSDTAAQTRRKKDSQVPYPEDDQQVKSDTLPLLRPAGAADAISTASFTSENVHQKSSSPASEALSNMRSDSSTTAHAAMLPDDNLMSPKEALQLEERYLHAYYLRQVA